MQQSIRKRLLLSYLFVRMTLTRRLGVALLCHPPVFQNLYGKKSSDFRVFEPIRKIPESLVNKQQVNDTNGKSAL